MLKFVINSSQYSAAEISTNAHTSSLQGVWGDRIGRTKEHKVATHSQLHGTTPSIPHSGLQNANIAAHWGPDLAKIEKHCTKKPSLQQENITQNFLIIYNSHHHCFPLCMRSL